MFSKTFVSVFEHPFAEPVKGVGRADPRRESYLASPVVLHGGGAGEAAANTGDSHPRQKAGAAGVAHTHIQHPSPSYIVFCCLLFVLLKKYIILYLTKC